MTNSNNTYIETGNNMLDNISKGGIPTEKMTYIIGKPRQTGNTFEYQKYMLQTWKKSNRQIKIKLILNKIK